MPQVVCQGHLRLTSTSTSKSSSTSGFQQLVGKTRPSDLDEPAPTGEDHEFTGFLQRPNQVPPERLGTLCPHVELARELRNRPPGGLRETTCKRLQDPPSECITIPGHRSVLTHERASAFPGLEVASGFSGFDVPLRFEAGLFAPVVTNYCDGMAGEEGGAKLFDGSLFPNGGER